jgi:ATP-grasp domain, R2K clade family 3
MQQFRGQIEGGICVRRHENFISETEKRYFLIQDQPFAAITDANIPRIVQECAARITSPFFSVDVIDRQDGQQRIVEIGDGQVSGLVGWTAARFAEIWSSRS